MCKIYGIWIRKDRKDSGKGRKLIVTRNLFSKASFFGVIITQFGRLFVLRFNATLTAKVISWRSVMHMCLLAFLTPELTQLSFQSHCLLFSHASAEVRAENTPERKFASTWSQTHNHQVMSMARLPLSHPGRAIITPNCLL